MADVTKVKIADGDPSGLVVCLNGILMRAAEGYRPLVSTLTPYGDVIGFDYNPRERMNIPELFYKVRQTLYEAQGTGRKVTFIGSSMGGMQVPFIVQEYREEHAADELAWLRKVILVDAPTGSETMKAVPDALAGFVASRANRFIAAPITSHIKVGPKDHAITMPSEAVVRELTGSAMSETEWKEWVKKTGNAGIRGYSTELQWSWTNWMILAGRNGSYAKALRSLHGLPAVYVAAVSPWNDVVAQPQAVEWHHEQCPTLKRVDVAAAHCGGGYLQNQPEYAQAFETALAA